MTIKDNKFYNKIIPVYSFMMTAILFLIILYIENILGTNNDSIFRSDLYAQYIPFIYNFLDCLNGNGSIWYSFSNYLGSGNILNIAYYAINPFNFLFLLRGLDLEFIIVILITLKISLAAATFEFYAERNLSKNKVLTLILSIFYGLSGFTFILHYNIMWLDVLYMLPIIIHLIIRLIKSGKFIGLIFAYTYLFAVNFYMAYMAGVFSAIFYIVYLLYNSDYKFKDNIKNYIITSIKFGFSVVLSAGICSFILLSTAGFLYSHIAEDNVSFETMTITIPDFINTFFIGQMVSYNNDLPYLYCGIIVLPLSILFFINKSIEFKHKILWGIPLVFYTISSFITPLYAFLHAFDYPNFHAFRYAFVIVFIVLSIACVSFDKVSEDSFGLLVKMAVSLIVFYSAMMVYQKYSLKNGSANSQNGLLINAIFIILWLAIFYALKIKKVNNIKIILPCLILVTGAEIIVNSHMVYKVMDADMHGLTDSEFNQWYYSESEIMNKLNKSDNSLYRTYVNNEWCYNAANMFGYNSINTFSSSDNYELRQALSKLGLSVSNREIEAHTLLPGFDSLFAIKYYVELLDYDSCEAGTFNRSNYEHATIKPNERALSMGYMVREDILDYQFTTNCFYNIENLCNTMTGLNKDIYTSISDVDIQTVNMNYIVDGQGMVFFPSSSAANTGAVQFTVSANNPNTFGYFYFEKPEVFGTSPLVYSGQYGIVTSSYLTMGGAYKCDYIEEEKINILGINSPAGQALDYRVDGLSFASYNEEEFEDIYEELSKNQMVVTNYTGDTITAKVTATEEKNILFTTIPYDPEWIVLVDGRPTTIYRVLGDAFMAIKLEPGEHQIRFMYIEKYSTIGLIISFVSILIFVFMLLIAYITRKKK